MFSIFLVLFVFLLLLLFIRWEFHAPMELMCHDQTLLCPFPSDFSYPHHCLALRTPCSLFKPTAYTLRGQYIHRAIGGNMDSLSSLGSSENEKKMGNFPPLVASHYFPFHLSCLTLNFLLWSPSSQSTRISWTFPSNGIVISATQNRALLLPWTSAC